MFKDRSYSARIISKIFRKVIDYIVKINILGNEY